MSMLIKISVAENFPNEAGNLTLKKEAILEFSQCSQSFVRAQKFQNLILNVKQECKGQKLSLKRQSSFTCNNFWNPQKAKIKGIMYDLKGGKTVCRIEVI